MGLLTLPASKTEPMTPAMPVSIANTTLAAIESIQEESLYIIIPLGLLLAIIILSYLVYLMAKSRRRFVHVYCKNRHAYNEYGSTLKQHIDTEEEDEEDEVDVDVEDDPAKCLLRGRLQINHRFENYLSTSQLSRSGEC